MITQKMIDRAKNNIVVRIMFFGPYKIKYECVGAISKIDSKKVQVIFNALHGDAIDYADILRKDIIMIERVKKIKVFM